MTHAPADVLFDALWRDYIAVTPSAPDIHARLRARGERVVNDHIALRTFDLEPIGLDALAAVFEAHGWTTSGTYLFDTKRLRARSLSHPDPDRPRVFISELITADFPLYVRATAEALARHVARTGRTGPDLLTAHPSWPTPDAATYDALLSVSEYAAWLSLYGLRANHFTVSVNALTTFDSLADLNAWLTAEGFPLNTSGGAIKGTPDDLLEQSSTLADLLPTRFACGATRDTPSCYVEFALRHPDRDGALFDGFVTQSADKIFESTDTQTTPRPAS